MMVWCKLVCWELCKCTRASLRPPPSIRRLLRTLTKLPANQLTPNHHIRHRSLSPSPTVHQPRVNPHTNPRVQFLLTTPRNPLDPSLGRSLTVHQRPRSHSTNLPSRPIINQLHLPLPSRHTTDQLQHHLLSRHTTDQLQHHLLSRHTTDQLQ